MYSVDYGKKKKEILFLYEDEQAIATESMIIDFLLRKNHQKHETYLINLYKTAASMMKCKEAGIVY